MRANLLLTVVVWSILSACNKTDQQALENGDAQGIGRCRLAGFTTFLNGTNSGSILVSYDSQGRIIKMDSYDFSYRGDTIFMNTFSCGSPRTDTIVHNGSRITMTAYGDNRAHQKIHYFYDDNGRLSKSSCYVIGSLQEDYFIWSNGDMITDSIVVDGQSDDVWRYEYDLNHSDQIGNPGTVMYYLTNGMPLYRTQHLRTRANEGSAGTYTYTYDFDENGKIKRAFVSGSQMPQDKFYFEYAYQCE